MSGLSDARIGDELTVTIRGNIAGASTPRLLRVGKSVIHPDDITEYEIVQAKYEDGALYRPLDHAAYGKTTVQWVAATGCWRSMRRADGTPGYCEVAAYGPTVRFQKLSFCDED